MGQTVHSLDIWGCNPHCVCLHAGAPAWAHKGTRAHLDDGHTAPTVPVRRGSRQRVIDFFNWGVWGVFGDSHKTLEYGPRKQEPDAAQK